MYTDLCIKLYFKLWLFAHQELAAGHTIPWKAITDKMDNEMYGVH